MAWMAFRRRRRIMIRPAVSVKRIPNVMDGWSGIPNIPPKRKQRIKIRDSEKRFAFPCFLEEMPSNRFRIPKARRKTYSQTAAPAVRNQTGWLKTHETITSVRKKRVKVPMNQTLTTANLINPHNMLWKISSRVGSENFSSGSLWERFLTIEKPSKWLSEIWLCASFEIGGADWNREWFAADVTAFCVESKAWSEFCQTFAVAVIAEEVMSERWWAEQRQSPFSRALTNSSHEVKRSSFRLPRARWSARFTSPGRLGIRFGARFKIWCETA